MIYSYLEIPNTISPLFFDRSERPVVGLVNSTTLFLLRIKAFYTVVVLILFLELIVGISSSVSLSLFSSTPGKYYSLQRCKRVFQNHLFEEGKGSQGCECKETASINIANFYEKKKS